MFTRELNNAVCNALRTSRPIKLYEALREEISHWLFLRTWDDPLPWRDERRIRISLATDASASGWGGSVTLGDRTVETTDYWTKEKEELDISVKEALVESFFCTGSIKWSPVFGVSVCLSASLSHGSCSAFPEIPRAVVHGYSLRCLS